MDMDPMLVRATRLLHSTSKTSADQLRAMLEEAIKQRYGETKSLAHLTITKEYIPKKETSSKHSSSSSSRREERDAEKKRFEKLSRSAEVTELPKPVEPIKSKPLPVPHEIELIREDVEIVDDNDDDLVNELDDVDEDDDDDDDDDDLALEILEDDLSCVVCRGMSVGALNQLVECLECHSLYHQECHQPPVARSDINDPRWAWYCAACTKAINKQPAKSSSSSSTSSTKSVSSTAPQSISHSSKSSHKSQSDVGLNLFKRQDNTFKGSSSGSSKSQASSASSVGMAGLAASFQPSALTGQGTGKSSSSSSGSSSAKVVPPKVVTNVISADKRLANMKKKAAAKQQEKRKHIK